MMGRSMKCGPWWLVLLWGVITVGCSSEPPSKLKTFVTRGSVKYKDGVLLPGGIVEFKSVQDETLSISSAIQKDGTFELRTMDGNHNLVGAVQGACRVIVTLPIVGGQPPVFFVLPDLVEVLPQDNQFDLQVPVPSSAAPK